jgi:3-phenylpropionate/trans-cinnamate dioxygenase ferredoxin subunit
VSTVVASLDALTDGQPMKVEVDGQSVVLVRNGDTVAALHDTCSHAQWSLSEGIVHNGEIECALHGAMFSLETGKPSCLPAMKPVPTYAVTVDGNDVAVDATTPLNGAKVPDHF